MDYNLVVIVGRLTRDPELKYADADGAPFTNLTMAVSRTATDAGGSFEKSVVHIDVAVWKHQAEICCQFARKGLCQAWHKPRYAKPAIMRSNR